MSEPYAAIMYFYEPFLEAFDPELRKELGVWYTPPEIVHYQVQRVDELLRNQLGCPRGFADEGVTVLDPCCGTGAYLVEVLRVIARQLRSEGVGALIGEHLLRAVMTRLVGFEILTAPFVIAHLQMYLLLSHLNAQPDEGDRAAIFLTNALTGWRGTDQPRLHFPELQTEHDAARSQKENARIVVVIGNPPYNRYAGVPVKEEVALADVYKGIQRNQLGKQIGSTALYSEWGIKKHLLDDLYIRFFRLAEECIGERAEYGVVSYISNNSYLNGRSHPIMRASILSSFDAIWIDNLHGNRLASERTPEGESCETIFNVAGVGSGIKVGTSISTLLKMRPSLHGVRPATVDVRDFWGKASYKRRDLLASIAPRSGSAEFRPYERIAPSRAATWKFARAGSNAGGYESWIGLDELFPVNMQGVNPNRGLSGSVIDFESATLLQRMERYFSDISFEALALEAPVLCEPRARYHPAQVRDRLRRAGFKAERIMRYLLFPFDERWIYYETLGKLLNEARPELFACAERNEFLIAVPQPRRYSETRPVLSSSPFDLHVHDRGAVGFPAEVNETTTLFSDTPGAHHRRRANLRPGLFEQLRAVWGFSTEPAVLARQLMRHSIALCHSPQYELDNKDYLAQDWARVPLPCDYDTFQESVSLGEDLGHLMNPASVVTNILATYLGPRFGDLGRIEAVGSDNVRVRDLTITYSYYGGARGRFQSRALLPNEIAYDQLGEQTGDLYLNPGIFLRNVPERVWLYEIGGYPVIKKWLGYRDSGRRPGTTLTLAEADFLSSMVQRIAAIQTIHSRLDQNYERCLQGVIPIEDLPIVQTS